MFHTPKIKLAAILGIILSLSSLIVLLYIANSSNRETIYYRLPIDTIFASSSKFKGLWEPPSTLFFLQPYTNPRISFPVPSESNNGFIYAKIHGGFERIRSSICDLVVVARLLNATLVIPELQSSLLSKGVSSKFKSFSYLYDEKRFIEALANDVVVVGSLPKELKEDRKKKKFPVIFPKNTASPGFYLEEVLSQLRKSKVVGLVLADGGCLQSVLPLGMEEYQRLRCRVAFTALEFRAEIKALGARIIERLRNSGKPYMVYHPGLVRETLAFHGCAELFQDLHTELIQYRRKQMIKRGTIKEELDVDSVLRKRNGSCPLMPQEVGLLLRAAGYPLDTIIYVAGSETFGGQRILLPLRAMYANTVDRSSLCSNAELASLTGPESPLPDTSIHPPPPKTREQLMEEWQIAGPRPRPLPPPPGRAFYPHEKEGWYGWLAEVEVEPVPSIKDLRNGAHRLLWDAVDYLVAVEADAFFPGFLDDGGPWVDFSGLVVGQRLHRYPSRVTFCPDRKSLAELFDMISNNLYRPSRNWTLAARDQLKKAAAAVAMPLPYRPSFLSHPLPDCSCTTDTAKISNLGGLELCPDWLKPSPLSLSSISESSTRDEAEDGDTTRDDDVDAEMVAEPDSIAGRPPYQDDEMDPDD